MRRTIAFWLVRSESDAEDIVQESYMRAFRGFCRFSGTDAKPWLLAVVRNAAYRWLSNRRRSTNVISLDEAFGGPGEEAAEAQIASEDPTPEAQLIGEVDRGLFRSTQSLGFMTHSANFIIEPNGSFFRQLSARSSRSIANVSARQPARRFQSIARATR